jgi:hypothetical protein
VAEGSVAWSGRFTRANVLLLIDSPARREIARRLQKGDSVVWLMLPGSDPKKNEAAAERLQAQLKKLEKSIPLPVDEGKETVKLLSELPLRVAFSILPIARTDPAEKLFVQMLLHTEKGLADQKGPMVWPVFGRGRALDVLVGEGINHDTIEEAARFLCGACSCQVKQLNPGIDLLLAADWDSVLENRSAVLPTFPGGQLTVRPADRPKVKTSAAEDRPATVPIPVRPPQTTPIPPDQEARAFVTELRPTYWLWTAVVLASLMVIGTGLWALRSKR